jgi:UDP-N-acetylmuramate--alanine ligase
MIKNILSLRRIKNIHFIGIGGSGMSGIAEVLLNLGYGVSGSDKNTSNIMDRLIMLGAKIFKEHAMANVAEADVIVVSSAIAAHNPELVAARNRRLPIISRAQMLAELMRFHYGITVAGTHGKTTTTSLLATILSEADLDPTFVIGGILNSSSTNARLGHGEYFVIEADESDASFLHFNPMASIVTNIDRDHMVAYDNDFARLKQAFTDFLHHLPFYGLAVLCIDDPTIRELIPTISRPIITYGFSNDADVIIQDFKPVGFGCELLMNLRYSGRQLLAQLNLPGKHNALNATAAAIIAHECCHVAMDDIANALQKFSGVGRRMQHYGEIVLSKSNKKITVIDDYGHHPKEITVTIEALRMAFPNRRLVLAFQPHRYSRTKDLLDKFVAALSLADQLLLMEIFAANEPPIAEINSMALIDRICSLGATDSKPVYVADNDQLLTRLPSILEDGDILLIQGAGNIGLIASQLKNIFCQHI